MSLQAIRANIPDFPGYDDEESRMKSDELVRAYVGEALARLNSRHPDYFAQREGEYEELLFRSGFANHAAFKSFEHARLSADQLEPIARNDAALLELADRAAAVQDGDFATYVKDLLAAFDRRDDAMKASKPE
jgi:hypothetical protein